ncbi:MAG: hypothetical protein ACFCGT_18515 [Sandaracinaceae bacterium]
MKWALTPLSFPFLLILVACDGGPAPVDMGSSLEPDLGALDNACPEGTDDDGDSLSNAVEGTGDVDADGVPNLADLDSDGDTFPDIEEAGDTDCDTPPPDLDEDGVPDFLDDDANGDNVRDRFQLEADEDRDGIPDYLDLDVDEDGIPNIVEWGTGETPLDTDRDGSPDLRDIDADGDTILDRTEGTADTDLDGLANYIDTDADNDDVPDAVEAGDADLDTLPRVCQREVDPGSGEVRGDGFADYVDPDSDNDGLGDGDEVLLGTDPCDLDSDDDGDPDIGEGAFERFNCPDGITGVGCGCAADPECKIPDDFFLVVLPFGPDEVEQDLDFSTAIQVADIFFLSDVTGSMGGTIQNVQQTIAAEDGLITRIQQTIAQAWFGGGTFQDFPFQKPAGGSYGGGTDDAFRLVIPMTPPSRAADVQAAWLAVSASGGADGPESHTEALFQALTGQGGQWQTDAGGGAQYMVPPYNENCLGAGWGAACFRTTALPIFILFTDICAHEGPRGESESCDLYQGIMPSPANWGDTVSLMNVRGAKFIGVAARSGSDCESGPTVPNTFSPCFFLRRTAEATESISNDGQLLVYDLPNNATTTDFVDQVAEGVETVATLVPIDVSTEKRDDPTDAYGLDAADFIIGRVPACAAQPFPSPTCWEEPPPPSTITFEEAVEGYDDTTFFAVLPGTTITFRVTFRNTIFRERPSSEVFLAFIDVVGQGGAVLDTRQVFVVVPAASSGGPG